MIRTIQTLKVEPLKVGHEHPIRIIGMQRRLIDLLFKVGQFSQLSHSGKQDDSGVKSL